MSSLPGLDESNVVDIDLGSAEFKANAHRHMAEWARRAPFYVLSHGQPQVVVGRYADVHQVFADTETFASEMPRGPGWEQFNKIMDAQFVTQMDGEQHARVRRLLMPAFSSRRIEQLQESIAGIVDGMLDRIEANGPAFDGMHGLRRASRRRCFAGCDGEHGRAAQGDLRRIPRSDSGHHLRQAGRAVVCGAAARLRPHHGRDQGHHRRAARQPAPGLHQRPRQCQRCRRQAQRPRIVRSDFRHLRRVAVGHQPRRRRCPVPALHARRPAAAADPAIRRSSRKRSRSACGSAATAISPFHVSPRATPRWAAHASSRAWWCGRRRSRRTTTRTFFPIRCASTSTASRSASFRSAPGLTIASATSWAAPPSPSRSRGCWQRFPKAHISDPNFTPVYGGAVGELRLQSLPMRIH